MSSFISPVKSEVPLSELYQAFVSAADALFPLQKGNYVPLVLEMYKMGSEDRIAATATMKSIAEFVVSVYAALTDIDEADVKTFWCDLESSKIPTSKGIELEEDEEEKRTIIAAASENKRKANSEVEMKRVRKATYPSGITGKSDRGAKLLLFCQQVVINAGRMASKFILPTFEYGPTVALSDVSPSVATIAIIVSSQLESNISPEAIILANSDHFHTRTFQALFIVAVERGFMVSISFSSARSMPNKVHPRVVSDQLSYLNELLKYRYIKPASQDLTEGTFVMK